MKRRLTGFPGWLFLIGALAAWVYLGSIILTTTPEDAGSRALFYVALGTALFFTASAVAYALGLRLFSPAFKGDVRVTLVQAIPPALLILLLVWLQSMRLTSLPLVAILFGLTVSLEYLLWPREYDD